MADTTTRYSLPYQESTDAPNGPALGKELAEAVEAAVGDVDDRVTAVELEAGRLGLLYRAHRSSNKTITTTDTPILRLDGCALKANRAYRISIPKLRPDAVTGTDKVSYRLRLNTAGVATTANAIVDHSEAADQTTVGIDYLYIPGADVTVSFLLSGIQYLGSSVVTNHADEAGNQILVFDEGPTVPDTGVDL